MPFVPSTLSRRAVVVGLAGLVTIGSSLTLLAQPVQVNGAGATFPYPLYATWFSEYAKVKPDVQIDYQPIGSGLGILELTNLRVFFGATDGPMTEEEMQEAPGRILHLPTVLGANVPAYNIEGVKAELKFTGQVLADIFLGKIRRWNDPAIAKLNAGVTLPASEITVVHRSDGSGTTYIWADYLAKVSAEWRQKIGVATSVIWPVGIGGAGNGGVAGLVKQIPGSIGYVELGYAIQNKIDYGSVQNLEGEFVRASTATVTAAAESAVKNMPRDFRVSITNAPGKGVYPVSSFTWLLLYQSPRDRRQSTIMVDFMRWALTEGQKYATDLGYAPLPPEIVKLEMEALATIKGS